MRKRFKGCPYKFVLCPHCRKFEWRRLPCHWETVIGSDLRRIGQKSFESENGTTILNIITIIMPLLRGPLQVCVVPCSCGCVGHQIQQCVLRKFLRKAVDKAVPLVGEKNGDMQRSLKMKRIYANERIQCTVSPCD